MSSVENMTHAHTQSHAQMEEFRPKRISKLTIFDLSNNTEKKLATKLWVVFGFSKNNFLTECRMALTLYNV